MKRIIALLFVISLCQLTVFGQKKYEMVVEKTDGSETVFNVEDVARTYFRERSDGDGETSYTSCPDANHPHLIDLGLPSGTKWACCNVGATTPEGYGEYYRWAETTPCIEGDTDATYPYDGVVVGDGDNIAGTQYDAATAKWGAPWRMPTYKQIQELLDNCTYTWTEQNGINGGKVTGPNGGVIFFPASGALASSNGAPGLVGSRGYYWSASPDGSSGGRNLSFGSGGWNWGNSFRAVGFTVRAVAETSCPDANHPHMIDLGLPSGTKWACCNVGASTPEGYGNYYAWGETQPKSVYSADTYLYYNNNNLDYPDRWVNIGSDIAGTQYDAATANWGAPWRMPSLAQIQELLNNCTSTWTTLNGVNGRKFTGPNGGTIFLPAAGLRWNDGLSSPGSWGNYWSSTLYEGNPPYANYLNLISDSAGWSYDSRGNGQSVRPVR